ncbi:hypothetical protein [Candidatus Chlamydia sanziniae]|nr:hypothetical protein [Candidatus Chlamydia sanziniae]
MSFEQWEHRANRTSFIVISLVVITLIIILLALLVVNGLAFGAGVIYGVYIFQLVGTIVGISLLVGWLAFMYWIRRDSLVARNVISDVYYRGIRSWNLSRGAVIPETKTIDKNLAEPFSKYAIESSLIALCLEHFGSTLPDEPLVRNFRIFRDFRFNSSSLFFSITSKERRRFSYSLNKDAVICEAFINDAAAHQGMIDCYQIIHANRLIRKHGLQGISVISSIMQQVDYPTRPNEGGRQGLVRIYLGARKLSQFTLLIPNYRLPMGPFFVSKYAPHADRKEAAFIQGLEGLLQLCILQKRFFALQWDTVCVDTRKINDNEIECIKIRSMSPKIRKQLGNYGEVATALTQWISALGTEQQLSWLEEKLDTLELPKSLGSPEAEILEDSLNFAVGTSTVPSSSTELQVYNEPEISPEPRVKLTEKEKQMLRQALQVRKSQLDLFISYQESFEEFRRSSNSDEFKAVKTFFNSKATRFRLLSTMSSLHSKIVTQAREKNPATQLRVSTVKSFARWCYKSLRPDLFFENKDYLAHTYMDRDRVVFRGFRVLEPGVEAWYTEESQASEIRDLLAALCREGYLYSFFETEVSNRFSLLV